MIPTKTSFAQLSFASSLFENTWAKWCLDYCMKMGSMYLWGNCFSFSPLGLRSLPVPNPCCKDADMQRKPTASVQHSVYLASGKSVHKLISFLGLGAVPFHFISFFVLPL